MILTIVVVCLATAAASNTTDATPESSTKEILKASESDPSKVEIVKQIRRLNDDGSYTIGYEADDGTFKIESRDVLGNVKGTFGYIDKDGEIKRVTYSSSSESTPVPVTTSTTPSTPAMVVRMNKTVSSTTRRPLATVVYPTRGSHTTRGTVIQSIPRRRASSTRPTPTVDSNTEKQKTEETTTSYKPKVEDTLKTRTQILKPMPVSTQEDLITKQTTTKLPSTIKPVYEDVMEKEPETERNKANTIRRQLSGTSPNPHMISLQQSAGDDSTDEYGSQVSLGTIRPLFTTTTPRPRLVPIHSIVAARQRIQQQYQEAPLQDQETTVEASTGRIFDNENVVTTNPVPVVHIPPRDPEDRIYQQPIYRRPSPAVQFRTREYLRDNPGAAVPIGNQRPFLQYEFPNKVLEPQFVKEVPPTQKTEATTPYEIRPATRIIPIPVDERGVPLQGYQGRFVNPYRAPVSYQPRYEPGDEMGSISAPVSTRDLRRLLYVLILRQNRLQSLMDQMLPGPPYPVPMYRDDYRYQSRYQDDGYDYRYEPYRNEYNYDNQYDQRYMSRRRLYTRPYDTAGSATNHIDDMPEYLPPEVREALLLKMLILAISPDFVPTTSPPTELTTAAPPRKQVRNVQILGEEGSSDDTKKTMQRH
ncbi:proteoglycan 4-like [Manduca sexta]|uniref:proteoglycan 4-like n=1 Tax=Manduca sexta TaxID=7130 RepID=UPI00189042A5|nr:proteoglycan 4-like [Manduca sexta]